MLKPANFYLSQYSERGMKLIDKVTKLFLEIGFSIEGMPKSLFDNDKPLSLVFAGQYSAGKSTILKALTGIKSIDVGAGITTQKAHSYDWNGLKVIDTPGIHTSLRPEHDAISYQAIADADMLVYVVTQELFDDFVGQNFRKLLIDKDKAKEMILVVNKMAAIGNSVENQEIKLKDLGKVTKPYTPAELKTVFLDAESYVDSLEEEDDELRDELRERSNFDVFVNTLNNFVEEKGIDAKLTTSIYKLDEVINEALKEYQSSTGDADIDAWEEHLLQERSIIREVQREIECTAQSIYYDSASKIRKRGREIADEIYSFQDQDAANSAIEEACREVDVISSKCGNEIIKQIQVLSAGCDDALDEFYKSDFSRKVNLRLETKYNEGNPLLKRILKYDLLSKTGKGIIRQTTGEQVFVNSIKTFSGSNAHKTVLEVGKFFGHKFKPWEAVKVVKGLNNVGKVLGVLGVVISIGMQIKEDIDAEKLEKEMRTNRENLRGGFNSAADELTKYFQKTVDELIERAYAPRIKEIDNKISAIRTQRKNKSDTCKLLESYHNDCRLLISEIHHSEIHHFL